MPGPLSVWRVSSPCEDRRTDRLPLHWDVGLAHRFCQRRSGLADAEDGFRMTDQGTAHRTHRQVLVVSADDLDDPFGRERFAAATAASGSWRLSR